jgi:hypothetical protein
VGLPSSYLQNRDGYSLQQYVPLWLLTSSQLCEYLLCAAIGVESSIVSMQRHVYTISCHTACKTYKNPYEQGQLCIDAVKVAIVDSKSALYEKGEIKQDEPKTQPFVDNFCFRGF